MDVKICPFMEGNICEKELCALWPQIGKMCSLTQIGMILASINIHGIDVNIRKNEKISQEEMK